MRLLAVAVAALALGTVLAPPDANARRFVVVCTDGDRGCDLDRACNGVCRVQVDRRTPLAIRLRAHAQRPGKRTRRVGRDVIVARCLPPTEPCKRSLPTGCRADLGPAACAAHAGDYGQAGLNPNPSCHCRTTDNGTPCASALDCQGMCLAPFGDDGAPFLCSTHVTEFGCFAILDDHGQKLGLCVD